MKPNNLQGKTDFIRQDGETLLIRLSGIWKIGHTLSPASDVENRITAAPRPSRIAFDSAALEDWDSGLLTFLLQVSDLCRRYEADMDISGLPEGAQRLIALATAVPAKKDARRKNVRPPWLARMGENAVRLSGAVADILAFIGEASLAFMKMAGGKARFRRSDLMLHIQESGPQALPIVTLISVLVGLILAFVGAIQLKMFGAEIFVADLVGLGMAREMGAMMAAVIMAGRTGAAYAAQLGTMQVNEEIDALRTLGISPMEFLVLPRMLALALMMPLLCIYADIMGILGGALVSVVMLDIPPMAWLIQTQGAIPLHHFATGLIKSVIFGILVALCGCLRGMQCGRSASAVGDAATSAVVTAIVAIVVSDALFTVIFSIIDI